LKAKSRNAGTDGSVALKVVSFAPCRGRNRRSVVGSRGSQDEAGSSPVQGEACSEPMRYIILHARRFRDRETIVSGAGNFINAGQRMNRNRSTYVRSTGR
jgi:hypothetical protein